jgi:putative tricarboxylic transport membrane protein
MTTPAPEPTDHGVPDRPGPDPSTLRATAIFGALMVVAAFIMIIDASRLRDTSAAIGPNVVPMVVGVLLGVIGAGLLVQSRSALRPSSLPPSSLLPSDDDPAAADRPAGEVPALDGPAGGWRGVLILVVTLLAFSVLLPVLGFVVSSTALFVVAALLLGAPRRWTVLAYGWALSALVFLVFDRLIGLSLPTGPWGF